MFDFFSSNFKRRAFEKALKEVEKEGYEIVLDEEDYSATILPDIEREVAELSDNKKEEVQKNTEATLDISELSANENRKRPVTNPNVLTGEYVKSNKESFYDKLFEDSDTFLSKTEYSKGELLQDENTIESNLFKDTDTEDAEQNDFLDNPPENLVQDKEETYKNSIAEFNKKIQQQVFSDLSIKEAEKTAKLEKQRAEDLAILAEKTKALQEAESRANLAEEEKQLALAEAEKERLLRLEAEKKVADAKLLATVKTKPKTKRTTAKRKRKYDADIVGGFNF